MAVQNCPYCGAPVHRLPDGMLVCANGHVLEEQIVENRPEYRIHDDDTVDKRHYALHLELNVRVYDEAANELRRLGIADELIRPLAREAHDITIRLGRSDRRTARVMARLVAWNHGLIDKPPRLSPETRRKLEEIGVRIRRVDRAALAAAKIADCFAKLGVSNVAAAQIAVTLAKVAVHHIVAKTACIAGAAVYTALLVVDERVRLERVAEACGVSEACIRQNRDKMLEHIDIIVMLGD